MTLSKSTIALTSSLCIILIFVFAVNLSSTSLATASGNQESDSKVNHSSKPLQQEEDEKQEDEKQEDEEEMDREEQEGDEKEEWDEEIEGDEEFDQEEDDEMQEEDEMQEDDEEWEMEIAEAEMERASVESNIGRLELITRLTEIAGDDAKMAGYAIMHVGEYLEPAEAVKLLEQVIKSQESSKSVRNLAKLKLAEVYAEEGRDSDVKKLLKSILKVK